MAIFNNEEENTKDVETIIGPSVKVDGNFKGEGNVTVEGVVQGTLKTNHNLTVGNNAKIKAEVDVNNLFLSGEIRGNVKVKEKTVIKSGAKLFGNLETKILSVEEGGVINGKCQMINETEPEEKEKMKPTK